MSDRSGPGPRLALPQPAVSARWFGGFRIAFGAYLAVHFLMLVPYGPELFGRSGIFPDPATNPTAGILPNPLAWWGSPAFVRAFLVGLAAMALLFAAGRGRRWAALLLWFGWACLFNRNNLIANPSIPYVGLLLLLTLLVPPGEAFVVGRRPDPRWRFPAPAYWVAWVVMAVGYTYSGVVKLASPSWVDGSALSHVLSNPLARPGFLRELALSLPAGLLAAATWGALALEIAAVPMSLGRKSRGLIWAALVSLQLGILSVVAFADLTVGMLMVHLFTFDAGWLPRRWRPRGSRPQPSPSA